MLNHAPAYRGLLTVIGGKLTTHRALAEDVTDEVLRVLGKRPRPCVTRTRPFPGADTSDWPEFVRDFLRESPLDGASSRRLLQLYGVRARRVLDLAAEDPSLAEVVDKETGALAAEVVMAVCEEGAVTLADVMLRRILVGLNGDMGLSSAATCADVAVRHLGWDEGRARAEVAAYENELRRHRPRALAAAAGGGAGAGMDNDGRRP